MRVSGLNGVLKKLEDFGRRSTKALPKSLEAASEPVLAKALALAPYPIIKDLLFLRVKVAKNGRVIAIVGVAHPGAAGHVAVEAGGEVTYPANLPMLVEFGRKRVQVLTKKVLSNGAVVFGTEVKAVQGKPYMRPAISAGRSRARAIAAGVMRSEMKQ